MPTFTGTDANETITPTFVSPTVATSGAAAPTAGFDLIDAGGGDDVVEGGGGDDTVLLGSGNDRFTWRRGDGNDVVEGHGGVDILRFLATGLAETLTLTPNLNRARLESSNAGGAAVDLDLYQVERIELAMDAFDGAVIHDLRGTGIADVAIEIAPGETFLSVFGFLAGTAAVNLVVTGDLDLVVVTGLGARVTIAGLDGVTLNSSGSSSFYVVGSAGNDTVDTSGLDESVAFDGEISLAGNEGDDTFILGAARERVDGGPSSLSDVELVDYRHSTVPVAVVLDATGSGSGYGGYAQGDAYLGVDGAVGSAFGDIMSGGFYSEGLGGDDQLYAGVDYGGILLGGAGNDFLQGRSRDDLLDGGIGNDTLRGGAGTDVMRGGAGDDVYHVDIAGDLVEELAGDGVDRVLTAASWTLAFGSAVEVLTTSDNLARTAINLAGNNFAQHIYGNAGANAFDGQGGGDVFIGLEGDDRYFVRSADRIVESAGGGSDRVFAFQSFVLGAGSAVETLSTIANLATTAINLTGNELSQFLFGNAGANILDGKAGADVLLGLGGADSFAFTTALSGGNIDRISSFDTDDSILLENAVFAGLASGALNPNAFVTGTAAQDGNDRVLYDQATGRLYFDADGNGAGSQIHFATLDNKAVITASDFTVI